MGHANRPWLDNAFGVDTQPWRIRLPNSRRRIPNTDANRNPNGYGHSYCDTNSHCHCNTYGYSNGDSHRHTYGNGYANSYAKADTYAEACSNATAASNPAASAVTVSRKEFLCGNSRANLASSQPAGANELWWQACRLRTHRVAAGTAASTVEGMIKDRPASP